MREIRLILEDGDLDLPRRVRRLWRVERRDPARVAAHAHDRQWIWGITGGWRTEYSALYQNLSWGYLYDFSDGTLGVSRVREVNAALAALGCRVDPEVEAPRPVVDPILERLLDEEEGIAARVRARPAGTITWNVSDWAVSSNQVSSEGYATLHAEPPVYNLQAHNVDDGNRWSEVLRQYGGPLNEWRFDYTEEERF